MKSFYYILILCGILGLSLAQPQAACINQKFRDLIVNGGFQQNSCPYSWCYWNINSFNNAVPGWIPDPQIQIGNSRLYNSRINSNWVAQLDSNFNTCIKQILQLRAGMHTLQFDYAAREGVDLSSNSFLVFANGRMIKNINPQDYNVHTEELEFNVKNPHVTSQISFCGSGQSNSLGAVIDNVKLFWQDACLY